MGHGPLSEVAAGRHHLPGSILARITSKAVSRLGQARPFCRRALSICTAMGEAHSSVHAIKLSLQLRLARRSRRTSLLGLAHQGFLPPFRAVLCRAFALLPLSAAPARAKGEELCLHLPSLQDNQVEALEPRCLNHASQRDGAVQAPQSTWCAFQENLHNQSFSLDPGQICFSSPLLSLQDGSCCLSEPGAFLIHQLILVGLRYIYYYSG